MLVTCSNAELYPPLLRRILTSMVHVQKGWPGRQSPTTPISPPTPSKARQVFPTKADAGSTLILGQVQNHRGKVLRATLNLISCPRSSEAGALEHTPGEDATLSLLNTVLQVRLSPLSLSVFFPVKWVWMHQLNTEGSENVKEREREGSMTKRKKKKEEREIAEEQGSGEDTQGNL